MQAASAWGGPAPPVPGAPGGVAERHFESELEINDFPQHARWKVRGC